MALKIDAATVKRWLSEPGEIALIDVREAGQFGEGHPLLAVPLPYSRLEPGLPALAPNRRVRLVLCDAGDGVAERASRRAEALGYESVHALAGGVEAWAAAGFTLYKGVNVPSKVMGELVEHARHTPRITAGELAAMRRSGQPLVIIDGRPFEEYRRMAIPGGICCPNGELALRIGDIVRDASTTIVVNCAGRTRSIIGAETLIGLALPNPILALENGTQGWFLAGLELERGAARGYPERAEGSVEHQQARAQRMAESLGAVRVSAEGCIRWLADPARTTFLLDVRTAEEVAAGGLAGFVHAPGGQLIQATDQWVGVKGARIVVADAEEVRAPVVAGWLRRLGHEACWLEGGIEAARSARLTRPPQPAPDLPQVAGMAPADACEAIDAGRLRVIDLRSSQAFRQGHIPAAAWSIRPRLAAAVGDPDRAVLLVAEDATVARLAAIDLAEAGVRDVRLLGGGMAAWRERGLAVEASPSEPPDRERIDFLFFVHDRHEGNAEAARGYLAWEQGLVAQLDDEERAVFRV